MDPRHKLYVLGTGIYQMNFRVQKTKVQNCNNNLQVKTDREEGVTEALEPLRNLGGSYQAYEVHV